MQTVFTSSSRAEPSGLLTQLVRLGGGIGGRRVSWLWVAKVQCVQRYLGEAFGLQQNLSAFIHCCTPLPRASETRIVTGTSLSVSAKQGPAAVSRGT